MDPKLELNPDDLLDSTAMPVPQEQSALTLPLKRFFDDKDKYTDEGRAFDLEVNNALSALVRKWGPTHSARDMQLILTYVAQDLCLDIILDNRRRA